jgi:ppGpp synthetase/RelA/SpoT-type nucleotidyltranferase
LDLFHEFYALQQSSYTQASLAIEEAVSSLLRANLFTERGDEVPFNTASRVKTLDSALTKLAEKLTRNDPAGSRNDSAGRIETVHDAVASLKDLIGVRVIFDRPLDADAIDIIVRILQMEGGVWGVHVDRTKWVANDVYQAMHVICRYVTADNVSAVFEVQLRDKWTDEFVKLSHSLLYKPCALSGLPNPRRNQKHMHSVMSTAKHEKAVAVRRLRREDDRLHYSRKRPTHELTNEPTLQHQNAGQQTPEYIENQQRR